MIRKKDHHLVCIPHLTGTKGMQTRERKMVTITPIGSGQQRKKRTVKPHPCPPMKAVLIES
ncbi:hypothetical protein DPMN_008227 [Dreissena polymorpha]|uniref:Uncharacterized protein n=1 Tax=Dreissena polymorpha TaxID=45954 RepID=A0A9D4RYY4_DREPO|nr:hypothetical protein DPMN_008227 [Dreissena polymorpha]